MASEALTVGGDAPSVDPHRFDAHGTWAVPPRPWSAGPEDRALDLELRGVLREALDTLPEAQRTVVVLRDVHGVPADEVCELLDVSAANQRVLLHRGRSRVRAIVEQRLGHRTAARG